jgi:hypothetical protein
MSSGDELGLSETSQIVICQRRCILLLDQQRRTPEVSNCQIYERIAVPLGELQRSGVEGTS